jgi:hypothetical protein
MRCPDIAKPHDRIDAKSEIPINQKAAKLDVTAADWSAKPSAGEKPTAERYDSANDYHVPTAS